MADLSQRDTELRDSDMGVKYIIMKYSYFNVVN